VGRRGGSEVGADAGIRVRSRSGRLLGRRRLVEERERRDEGHSRAGGPVDRAADEVVVLEGGAGSKGGGAAERCDVSRLRRLLRLHGADVGDASGGVPEDRGRA
jgi:hypothetical protein